MAGRFFWFGTFGWACIECWLAMELLSGAIPHAELQDRAMRLQVVVFPVLCAAAICCLAGAMLNRSALRSRLAGFAAMAAFHGIVLIPVVSLVHTILFPAARSL